ncbi:hypothetical protein DL503_17590, partial [Morganella morganii]
MYAYSLNLTTRKCLSGRVAARHNFFVGQCSQCSHTDVCSACCAPSFAKLFSSLPLESEYFQSCSAERLINITSVIIL